ncbi:ferritin-like domain-containing protein [Candidimonas humi]|uniref:Ferritin-like domain-containing protein n=1 Tax=Candidimonas humi TaxID=683355 RepID=A0ABV8NTZ3_9BURK|nr:ferritin-like domain-containing protein [Candidimonas humi]
MGPAPRPDSLRQAALAALAISDPQAKLAALGALDDNLDAGAVAVLAEPAGLPGRPDKPELVAPQRLRKRAAGTPAGLAALIHSLAHIEFNAINLALDAAWRFAGMPAQYYRDWARVAREEGEHFGLLAAHLRSLGHEYGDFPAHDGLWEMAERTRGDALARMALVPRTLEARGLDASPVVRGKLAAVGDARGAAIVDIILRDEIGHVAIGNRWYRYLCEQQGLDPYQGYQELAAAYRAPRLRGPFNFEARRAAGFSDRELEALQDDAVDI